jgi:hypothetical protein
MDGLKASKQPLGAEAIWGLNDWFRDFAPPVLLAPTAAINFSTRLFNLTVTNVPGPQVPLYSMGAEMLEAFPYVGIVDGQALMIAVLSYDGQLGFGITGDRDVLPDLAAVARGIEAAVVELAAAVRPRPARRRSPARDAARPRARTSTKTEPDNGRSTDE